MYKENDKKINESCENKAWSVRMAETVMYKFPTLTTNWSYDYGVVFRGIESVFENTGERKYYEYIEKNMDYFIQEDGSIKGYQTDVYNIDHINNGKAILFLYKNTGKEKYKKAAQLLRSQLKTHPRTSEGGFWHKKIYPYQMWLDGLYMGGPFYAEYCKIFKEIESFDDVSKQYLLMNKHAKDPKTGLLYHGWDESKEQKWANKETGCSPHFWGRAMGWYAMALVDVIEYLPETHKDRHKIIEIFRSMVAALALVQHRESGLWYQVVDQAEREGNYPEASASCMYTYAIAKAVRKGYIGRIYLDIASRAMEGILKNFVETDEQGYLNIKDTVYVSGLGGNPYRDGSYEYYISEPKQVNNLLGIGAFIQACTELELLKEEGFLKK